MFLTEEKIPPDFFFLSVDDARFDGKSANRRLLKVLSSGLFFVEGIDPLAELLLLRVVENRRRDRPDVSLQLLKRCNHRLCGCSEPRSPVVLEHQPPHRGEHHEVQEGELWIGFRGDGECGRRRVDQIGDDRPAGLGRRIHPFRVVDGLGGHGGIAVRVAHQLELQLGFGDDVRFLGLFLCRVTDTRDHQDRGAEGHCKSE